MSKPKTVEVVVDVKRKHIKEGTTESATTCPIALALMPMVAKTPWVQGNSVKLVDRDTIYYVHASHRRRSILPAAARRFIKRFDAGKPVKPFKFKLKLKETVLKKPTLKPTTNPMVESTDYDFADACCIQ